MRQVSAKNAVKERELVKSKKAVLFRSNGMCEVATPVCPPEGRHRGAHHHHVKERSAGGGHDKENLLFICLPAHDWIHTHQDEAIAAGWLRPSWA